LEQSALLEWLKRAALVGIGFLLLMMALATGLWFWSYPPAPEKFFNADISPDAAHGELIRSEPFFRGVPSDAQAVRILYTTTLTDDTPATASAVVMWRTDDDYGNEPRPALVWAHGTFGAVSGCGASLQARPFQHTPGLEALLQEGWVFIATDYAGLTTAGPHPYLIGKGEAHSVLDAALAAYNLPEPRLSGETVIWGHSQGGHSALWSGGLARAYAPGLHLLGVAAIAPASDLPGLLMEIEETPAGRILTAYVARAYADTYPDISFDGLVRGGARWQAQEMSARCLAGPRALVPALIASKLVSGSIFERGDVWTAFQQRLADNVPAQPIGAPVLILQGQKDEIVAEPVQAAFVSGRCAASEIVQYQTFQDDDHLSIVNSDAQSVEVLMGWTRARFQNETAQSTCR